MSPLRLTTAENHLSAVILTVQREWNVAVLHCFSDAVKIMISQSHVSLRINTVQFSSVMQFCLVSWLRLPVLCVGHLFITFTCVACGPVIRLPVLCVGQSFHDIYLCCMWTSLTYLCYMWASLFVTFTCVVFLLAVHVSCAGTHFGLAECRGAVTQRSCTAGSEEDTWSRLTFPWSTSSCAVSFWGL